MSRCCLAGTAKRVSIATPQPSKSTGPKAPVVRTPYPKSSEKPSSEEADDVEESERAEEEEETGLVMALSTEIGMDVDVPASGSSTPAPGAASASDAAAMTPEFQPLPKSVVKSATKPVRPASAAPAASKYQQVRSRSVATLALPGWLVHNNCCAVIAHPRMCSSLYVSCWSILRHGLESLEQLNQLNPACQT